MLFVGAGDADRARDPCRHGRGRAAPAAASRGGDGGSGGGVRCAAACGGAAPAAAGSRKLDGNAVAEQESTRDHLDLSRLLSRMRSGEPLAAASAPEGPAEPGALLTYRSHWRSFHVDPGQFVTQNAAMCCSVCIGLRARCSLCLRRGRVCSMVAHAPVACPGADDAPREPDPRRRQPGRNMPDEGHAGPGAAPAHDHATARAARIRPVPSGQRRRRRGLVPARCTLILHPRAARGPAPGPPALAAGAPISPGPWRASALRPQTQGT